MVIAAAVFGIFFYSARSAHQTIYVVGAATGRFQSDVVKWRIAISRSAKPATIGMAYDLLKGDLKTVADFRLPSPILRKSAATGFIILQRRKRT
jgi:hypothetical protein